MTTAKDLGAKRKKGDNSHSKAKFPRQIGYDAHMRELGFTRAAPWVPKENRQELLDIAEEMRNEYFERQGIDPAIRLQY